MQNKEKKECQYITESDELNEIVTRLRNMKIDAAKGLPEELFLFVSGIMPVPNVDLLISNKKEQILLSWRDDIYFGKGWHIPGGCIRYGETMQERIQKTALKELGTEVIAKEQPLIVKDILCGMRKGLPYPNERGHHITMLYECFLPDGFVIDNKGKREDEAGFLKWFDKVPENLLDVHSAYNEVLSKWRQ